MSPTLSRKNLARFLPTIQQLLANPEQPIILRDDKLANTTVAARLRDALRDVPSHPNDIDLPAFYSARGSWIVKELPDGVFFGPKNALEKPLPSLSSGPSFLCTIPHPTPEQLDALCLLYSLDTFPTPAYLGTLPLNWTPPPTSTLVPHGSGHLLL